MNYFLISSILNALISIITSIFILLNNPKSARNRSFAYFAFFVAIWASAYHVWIDAPTKDISLFYMRISIGFAIFIPVSFFHFSTNLINEYYRHKTTIILLYIYSLILFLTAPSNLFIFDAKPLLIFNYWPIAGIVYKFHVLNYTLIPFYGLYIIHKKIKESSTLESKQLKPVFWGVLLAYIGGGTNFPLCYNIPLLPIGNIFVSFYILFIAYSILRYELMDIKIVIKKGLVYTILITIISLFYLLTIYLLEHILKEIIGYKSFYASLISATIIALIFIPLKNIIQTFVENTFFRGSYFKIAEENEQLRQEIMQTERLKSVAILASGMAHEIKNPLTVLKAFTEYLPRNIDNKAFFEKYGPMISQEVDRIDNLVHELLDFAKPAPAVLKLENLCNLLDSTTELLSNQCIKYNIKVSRNYQISRDTFLELDHNQIRQALLNIFLNAIEAMKNGGHLNISTFLDSDNNKIQIKIQDTGMGIDPDDISHIFDPFFTKKDSGTGLGLSITHEIIKKHSGKIFVESVQGKGTTFILELPLPKALPS